MVKYKFYLITTSWKSQTKDEQTTKNVNNQKLYPLPSPFQAQLTNIKSQSVSPGCSHQHSHCIQTKSRRSEKSSSHPGFLSQFYYFVTCCLIVKLTHCQHVFYIGWETGKWKYVRVTSAILEAHPRESAESRISGPFWAI